MCRTFVQLKTRTSMNTPIGFGVIGLGHIGKRHAEMVKRHGECELHGMVDVRSA